MLSDLPIIPPDTPLLDRIEQGDSLHALNTLQLLQISEELRAYLLYSVGQTGGHFGAGLGVIELTVALHHIYNTPHDRIVWDVGHQTYPHKILTGRRGQMHSMRQADGLAGFPKRAESEYDTFGVGHSSTSISAAMGMALAARQQGINRKVIAVIGDGAITGGMAIEALAHAGHERPNMLVILNDNQMSIGHNKGENMGQQILYRHAQGLKKSFAENSTCLGVSQAHRGASQGYGRPGNAVRRVGLSLYWATGWSRPAGITPNPGEHKRPGRAAIPAHPHDER